MKTFFAIRRSVLLLACAVVPIAFATPTISFVTPTSGSQIPLPVGGGITVSVNAAPTSGASIVSVQFTANGVNIGAASGLSPFTITWTPTLAGNYTLAATVTDNSAP